MPLVLVLVLALVSLGACARHRLPQASLGEPAGQQEAPVLAGTVTDGVFVDVRYGFQLPVPQGWTANPGRDAAALRVSLTDAQTGTVVELWALSDMGGTLRRRADCDWTFEDTARYRSVGMSEPVTTGTCTPHDPADPRVYGWLLPGARVGVQAEIHVPVDHQVDGRRRGEQVLRGLER